MENSLAPAFGKINYQSRWGIHSMVFPTVPLNNVGVVNTPPNFDLRGAAVDVNADDAIKDYVDILKPFFRTDTVFVDYTLYTQAGAGDSPVPVWSAPLDIHGAQDGTGDDKATQRSWQFRADDFTLFKIVTLDVPSNGQYDKVTSSAGNPALAALIAYVTADVVFLASRGGGRPNVWLSMTTTKNEKLRRAYRMG